MKSDFDSKVVKMKDEAKIDQNLELQKAQRQFEVQLTDQKGEVTQLEAKIIELKQQVKTFQNQEKQKLNQIKLLE